jgi:hypothetical protein
VPLSFEPAPLGSGGLGHTAPTDAKKPLSTRAVGFIEGPLRYLFVGPSRFGSCLGSRPFALAGLSSGVSTLGSPYVATRTGSQCRVDSATTLPHRGDMSRGSLTNIQAVLR